MKAFKFFVNPAKNKCQLTIGSSFIFQGCYCVVTRMGYRTFTYDNQETNNTGYMTYVFYLTTQSAMGRQLNKR
jgi:hypothetical protein